MYTFDHDLFLALNFDGGTTLDRIMLAVSGTTMWIPLYLLILWLVWRRTGWRGTVCFLVLMIAAIGLADMVSGIFKQNGVLGSVLPSFFEPRLRPSYTPSLEGLDITPDSLAVLRRSLAPQNWVVHVPNGALGGRYGTVSAHAATIVALAVLSARTIRRRWFSWLVGCSALLICYSRIYLAKHFPMDLAWGALLGLLIGYAAYCCFRGLEKKIAAK